MSPFASDVNLAKQLTLLLSALVPVRTHVNGVGGVFGLGAHNVGIQQLEPRRPGPGPLDFDADTGDELVGVAGKVEGLPLCGVLTFQVL